jgi:hypothetical protein
MTRRNLMWTGVIFLVLLAMIGLWTVYGTHRISLTEADVQDRIQRQLDKDFPIKGAARLLVKTVRLQGATVNIQDGRVIALVDVEGVLRTNKKFTLTAYAVGVPTYIAGEFYFKPDRIAVQKFAYEGSTPTEMFSRFSQRFVTSDKTRQAVEDYAPKVEEWMTAIAQNAVVHSLEKRPVYRPKDDVKGLLIKASLDSVTVDQNRIVITFSLWQLTLTVLLGVICLIAALGLGLALIRHPVLGAALILTS